MKELKSCTVCNSKRIHCLYKDQIDYHTNLEGKWDIWKCRDCGLFFLNPMKDDEELSECYATDYYSYHDYTLGDKKVPLPKRIWRRMIQAPHYIPKLKNGAGVLDLGCGSGKWLYELKERNPSLKLQGCDVSKEAAILGKKIAGIDIFPGKLTDSKFESESFDFVRSNHSFEHINNPHETLDEIHRILKVGGYLFIGVPNTAGVWSMLFKKYWYYVGAPIHVYNYNATNLKILLNQHGFKIKKIRYSGDFCGIAVSMEIKNKAKADGSLKYLYPLFQIIAKITNLLRMGDAIEVIAVKE